MQDSKWALEEYDRWNANPCGYVAAVPPPTAAPTCRRYPTSASNSTLCTSAGSRFAVWAVTNGTPPG